MHHAFPLLAGLLIFFVILAASSRSSSTRVVRRTRVYRDREETESEDDS